MVAGSRSKSPHETTLQNKMPAKPNTRTYMRETRTPALTSRNHTETRGRAAHKYVSWGGGTRPRGGKTGDHNQDSQKRDGGNTTAHLTGQGKWENTSKSAYIRKIHRLTG